MITIRYLLDVNSRTIHKLEFMQDGDILKPMRHLSDTIKIFNNIPVDTKKCRLNKNVEDKFETEVGFERFCTNQKVLDAIMYSDFEIFETEKEAQKRLNELRVKK